MASNIVKSEIELYTIKRVKEMRVKAGLSQAQLAIEMNLSVGFIGHVESPAKRAKYNLNHLNRLAIIFNCPFQEFFPEQPFNTSSQEY